MIRVLAVAGLVALFGSAGISAQDFTVPRGGLFSSTATDASRSRVDVTAAVSQARDSQTPPELRSLIPQSTPQSGGYFSMLLGAADYERRRSQFDLKGSAGTVLRYFPSLDRVSMMGSSAALGGIFRLAGRTRLELNQDAAYSPSYMYRLFLTGNPPGVGDSIPAAPDYRIDETPSYFLDTKIKFAAGSPRGHSVELTGARTSTDFHGVTPRPDLRIFSADGRWARGIGRTGAVSAQFEFRRGEFGYGGRTTERRLRIGGELTPALSRTRRASFRFNIAPSMLEIPDSATNAVVTGTLFNIEGEAEVRYPFLRSWSAEAAYKRGVEYIAVLQEPVFRDAVRLQLSGLVTSRIDVTASAGTSVGESALNRGGRNFDTYTGTVQGRYGVSRSFALYGEYLYYYYNLHRLTPLAPGLPPRFEQHGVRAGVMLWARPVGR